jgi:hypothetical protein
LKGLFILSSQRLIQFIQHITYQCSKYSEVEVYLKNPPQSPFFKGGSGGVRNISVDDAVTFLPLKKGDKEIRQASESAEAGGPFPPLKKGG